MQLSKGVPAKPDQGQGTYSPIRARRGCGAGWRRSDRPADDGPGTCPCPARQLTPVAGVASTAGAGAGRRGRRSDSEGLRGGRSIAPSLGGPDRFYADDAVQGVPARQVAVQGLVRRAQRAGEHAVLRVLPGDRDSGRTRRRRRARTTSRKRSPSGRTRTGTSRSQGCFFTPITPPTPAGAGGVEPGERAAGRSYWSVQITAFKDNPLRKQAAVDAVKELRAKGVEAYYYHGADDQLRVHRGVAGDRRSRSRRSTRARRRTRTTRCWSATSPCRPVQERPA